ncbi:hypothetical protein, partial [Microlunatus ginsengisoli]|uniref:hypothetical protein n=1 Tax=Microlunatus ginsengisoli TaxID=363863 RepID=UPI0031E3F193
WDDPGFFPIGVWWSGVSSASEVNFDKSLGLNFYTEINPDTDYNLIQDNGMYWVGQPGLRNLKDDSPNWVGSFLGDEVDGRFDPPSAGFTELQRAEDAAPPAITGRFRYANFTSSVLSYDRKPTDAEKYVNDYTDAVSIDAYFHSVPQCSWDQNWARYIVDVPKSTCRTAHTYGQMIDALRIRDQADGHLQMLWNFIEPYAPETADGYHAVSPEQVKGATMASIIHEARGIIYFNQVFSGPCATGNFFRAAQNDPHGCAGPNTQAVKEVNTQIKTLAPVINTQSYRWTFGPQLDTMLKIKDGYAYIFAMTDGTQGKRTLQLPTGLTTTAEVLNENRRITTTN